MLLHLSSKLASSAPSACCWFQYVPRNPRTQLVLTRYRRYHHYVGHESLGSHCHQFNSCMYSWGFFALLSVLIFIWFWAGKCGQCPLSPTQTWIWMIPFLVPLVSPIDCSGERQDQLTISVTRRNDRHTHGAVGMVPTCTTARQACLYLPRYYFLGQTSVMRVLTSCY